MNRATQFTRYCHEEFFIRRYLFQRTALSTSQEKFIYIQELFQEYKKWFKKTEPGSSKISLISFSRAIPKRYKRKLMNRGRGSKNPARAILGIVFV
jgi:hypothetical protein